MQPSKRRETTDCEILISVQKCRYGEICVLSGSSPAGGPVVPGLPIWNRCPPFQVWPTGFCIHPILYIKNVPPLLVYGPSFWFLAPPAAKYWRLACVLYVLQLAKSPIRGTNFSWTLLNVKATRYTTVCELRIILQCTPRYLKLPNDRTIFVVILLNFKMTKFTTSCVQEGMLVWWNIHTVATAVQPTLFEMTNHWCNL